MRVATIIAVVAAATIAAIGLPAASAAPGDPADLAVSNSDNPDPVMVDAVLTYTVKVDNLGPDAATNVVVTDDLDSQVEKISASVPGGTCDVKGKTATCTIPSIANADSATVTVLATPKKAGTLQNTASVKSDVVDPVSSNNSAGQSTTVFAPGPTPSCHHKAATIVGTPASETLNGTPGRDVVVARGGNDTVLAGAGNDIVCGNGGNDRLSGESGSDTLRGARGRDRIKGGLGNDLLSGGRNRDHCSGGPGHDIERSC